MVRTCALAVVLVLLWAAGASACGYTVRAAPRGPRPAGHRNAVVIGDSTLVFAAPKLARRGLRADAKECRQFSEGLAIVRAKRRAGGLAHLVVLALGANGPVTVSQLRAAVRAVGRHRVLGLVTPRNLSSSASAMRTVARRRPERVLLMDWRAYSAGRGGWFAGDGLHVNDAGARAYAAFIARHAAGVIAPPHLHGLRSGRAQRACGHVRRAALRLAVDVVRAPDRISCREVQRVARRHPLRLRSRWRWYDWRPMRAGPWRDVYVRGRMVFATRTGRDPAIVARRSQAEATRPAASRTSSTPVRAVAGLVAENTKLPRL